MYGIVRHTLAIMVVLCLESLAAGSSVGQVPKGAEASIPAPERARALYVTNCSACHGTDGEGRPGTYPPIKGSGIVTKDDATKHIRVVLNGLQGAKAGGVLYASPMPPFGSLLNDLDIADIINYERSSWGNHGKPVTATRVAAQRGVSK
jgi:cytochrome c oxidase cbb3-type subunit 2